MLGNEATEEFNEFIYSIFADKQSRVKVAAERFEVSDTRGRNILASTPGTTVISSPNLQIQSK